MDWITQRSSPQASTVPIFGSLFSLVSAPEFLPFGIFIVTITVILLGLAILFL